MNNNEILNRLANLLNSESKAITINRAIDNFIEYSKVKNRIDTTYYYQKTKKYMQPFFKAYDIKLTSDIDIPIMHKMVSYFSKTLSINSVNKRIEFIKMVIKYNYDIKEIDENPIRDFKKLPKQKVIIKTIDPETFNKVLNYVDSKSDSKLNLRNKVLIHILAETGARMNEIIHMETKLLDLNNNRIKLEFTKCHIERYVYFSNDTKNLLIKYLEVFKPNKYLLEDALKKAPITKYSIQRTLETIKKDLNITQSISPHKWRHTLATNLLKNNINLYTIQKILGHSNITTTQIYLHTLDDEIKNDVLCFLNNKKR